jgi:hypothetical protein
MGGFSSTVGILLPSSTDYFIMLATFTTLVDFIEL